MINQAYIILLSSWRVVTQVLVVTVAGLALGWFATLWHAPRAAFEDVIAQMSLLAGENRLINFLPADANAMLVEGLSPDFLYSACVFDIRDGAVELRIPVVADGFWSASFYSAGRGHFFNYSMVEAPAGQPLWVEIVEAGEAGKTGALVVEAPAERGLAFVRFLRTREAAQDSATDRLRRSGVCAPLRE